MPKIVHRHKVKKPTPNFLSVIVPAYRCRTIYRDLRGIATRLNSLNLPWEIICVVDGKANLNDKTASTAKKARSTSVHVYTYRRNRGKGYAVRYGMARARGSLIAFIDAGSDLNAAGIGLALEHLKWYHADIIVGSKRHKASRVIYPKFRKILSFLVQTATRFFYGINVSDTQTGLKIFRRPVLEKVLPRMVIKRWAFDLEMLVVASRLGYTKIYESPVELSYNFASNIGMNSVFNFIQDYLAIIYRTYILRYYDSDHRDLWESDPKLKLRYHS